MKKFVSHLMSVVLCLSFAGLVFVYYIGVSIAFQSNLFASQKIGSAKSSDFFDVGKMQKSMLPKCQIGEDFGVFCYQFVQVAQDEDNQNVTPIYAKARANCVVFASPQISDTSASNLLFCVPQGYFVQLLDTSSDEVYTALYAGKIGYVLPQSVRRVGFVPQTPEPPEQSLSTKEDGGTQLRTTPSTQSAAVALVPGGSTLFYIASVQAQRPSGASSSEWHFVRYFPPELPTIYYEGYVHSERVETQPIIPPNTEDDPITATPALLTPTLDEPTKPLSPVLKGVVISLLTLPALLFGAYLIFGIHQRRMKK